MKLYELGELGLINLIREVTDKAKRPQSHSGQKLLVGIGDDASAWQNDGNIQLVTTDSLVENVHFDLDIISWEELGWKSLVVSLSDIAAMGGLPEYALVSLALPPHIEVDNIYQFYTSITQVADQFHTIICGGDIVAAPNVLITTTVFGYSNLKSILLRSAASPGEQIAVTGYLGLSSAGLEALKNKINLDDETSSNLRRGHFKPIPRIQEGQTLLQHGIRCAIDISDGLISDLEHICEASGVSATVKIDQVPVHPIVRENFPNYERFALHGGEDYELLFTGGKDLIHHIKQLLDCPVTVIGDIREKSLSGKVSLIDGNGDTIPYEIAGWEHFRQ